MSCRRIALLIVALVFTLGAAWAEDSRGKGQCVLNAFAARLGFTAEQKEQASKIHSDFEQKSAPICEQIWRLHWDHHQAVLQILSKEQIAELPNVMKGERAKMLQHFATKLGLNDDQKKEAEKICNEYADKFQKLDPKDAKASEKFQELKNAHFEAFCRLLTEDQRIKLPALMHEEIQAGRTPSAKSDIRNAMVDKLNLNADQKRRLDKVCDEFAVKIDQQKAQFRQLWKDKHAAIDKILNDSQRTKFKELVKSED